VTAGFWRFDKEIEGWANFDSLPIRRTVINNWDFAETLKGVQLKMSDSYQSKTEAHISVPELISAGVEITISRSYEESIPIDTRPGGKLCSSG
jgi:hypothetical protein